MVEIKAERERMTLRKLIAMLERDHGPKVEWLDVPLVVGMHGHNGQFDCYHLRADQWPHRVEPRAADGYQGELRLTGYSEYNFVRQRGAAKD